MAALAAELLRGAWVHKQIRVSHSLDDLKSRRVNIIHIQRPQAAVIQQDARQLMTKPAQQVVISAGNPDSAISHLLQSVHDPTLQQQVHDDLQQITQQICQLQHVDHVRAKLEIITRQSCPNFHADTVGIRLLCSYSGSGTWYVANKHVRRHYNPWTGVASIAEVDEQYAVQTAAGDLLYLKGNLFPGLHGAGAVHKSPEVVYEGQSRLLLTVDDACCS